LRVEGGEHGAALRAEREKVVREME